MNKLKNISGISVIIPCYNSGVYIEKCLNSLIKELNFIKYEIIIIDDKSTDNSVKIIENYIKERDSNNICLLKNEVNKGAGASRNLGIKHAKYDYISFIDADDYVSENFYKNMIAELEINNSDLIACDIVEKFEDGTKEHTFKACEFTPSKYNLISTPLAASPCNKIIKKIYLEKYPFPEGIINEDVPCILSIIANCNKVSYTENAKYFYVQHSGSVQNSPLSDKKLDIVKAFEIFDERIKNNKEYFDFYNIVIFLQIICMILFVPCKEQNIIKRSKFLKKINRMTKKYNLRNNKFYIKFINEQTYKSKLYYRAMMKLIYDNHSFLASLLITFCQIYTKTKNGKNVIKKDITLSILEKKCKKNSKLKNKKTLSVAIPNYNYEKYLYERLYSILNQNYKINELIILDDCSTDNSRDLLNKIEDKLKNIIKIKKIYNEKNSGSVFFQWQKCFEHCSSEYLWIAEADDYCSSKLVSSLMSLIENNNNISLAYSDTAFIDATGNIILKSIKPEIDIQKSGHWDNSFINKGIKEIKDYAYLNCTIANVSSVIFKVKNYSEILKQITKFKQVGDYMFYIHVMSEGDVGFINKSLNYYRVHGNNVTSTTKKQLHLDELKKVHQIIEKEYGLNSAQKQKIEERYKFLEEVWGLKDESEDFLYQKGYKKAKENLKKQLLNISELKNNTEIAEKINQIIEKL